MNTFTASLHTHVRSLFDADISAAALVNRIKQLNGKGCAITDHGVLSSIEDYRRVFAANDLKLIPGVELYVDGGILGRLHLVLLARNDYGYQGICKIVTESNYNLVDGFPVITESKLFEMIETYKGHIFALSACMQGVIAAIFLKNEVVRKKIEKIERIRDKYLAPDSEDIRKAKVEIQECESIVQSLIQKRDYVKKYADMKFAAREKAIAKLDPDSPEAKALLEDKKKSEEAKVILPKVKAKLAAENKRLTTLRNKHKSLEESVAKYLAHQNEIDEMQKEYVSEAEIYQLAKETAERYVDAFGKGRFLAEVQYHGIPEEEICFKGVARIAKELGLPLVATNDVHILDNSEEERLKRQILRSMRFGSTFEEESLGDSELYLKDDDGLAAALSKILTAEEVDAAIKNIEVVFNACDVSFETGKHYPKFQE